MDSSFALLSAAAAVALLSLGCGSAAHPPLPDEANGGVGAGGATPDPSGTGGQGGTGGRPSEACSLETWSRLLQSSSLYSAGAPRVAIGQDCSVLIVGGFHGTMDLGGGPLDAGEPDDGTHGATFFARYDSEGHHLVSRRFDSQGFYDIAATSTGFVLSGSMYSPTPDRIAGDLGCGPIPRSDLFTSVVALFDDGGQCIWSRRLPGDVDLMDVAVGPDDAIVLAGQFADTTDLGTGPLVSAGYKDGFVAKLSPSGETAWALGFGDAWSDEVAGVDVDETGAILLGGSFFDTLDLGAGPLDNPWPGAAAFLVELSPDGGYLHGQVIGGSDESGVQIIAVAAGPGVRRTAVGSYKAIDLSGQEMESEGDSDGFIVGFDASGTQSWASTFGGPGRDVVRGLAVDGDGHAVVTGSFVSPANFAGQTLEGTGSGDGFVTKYGPSGDLIAARAFGGLSGSDEMGTAVVTDSSRHAVLVGYFRGTADLGTLSGPMTSESPWSRENFIARITLE
jgi:hypothetical protein